jgi:peptidoglycan/LPS O-acetylase OafA/YrhL
MFFVISGFVLPLALSRSGYTLSDFPRFTAKRLVRLEPPYLVTVLVVVVLGLLGTVTPDFHGRPYDIDWTGLALHVGYLAPVFGKPWLVGVFWTLLIEMQFYLLIGATFPLFIRYPRTWILVLAVPAAFLQTWHGLPFHLPMFLIGTTAFAWRHAMIPTKEAALIALALAAYLVGYRGAAFAVASLAAAAYILWSRPKARWLLWLGTISYSFYLIHLPIGRRVINLCARFIPESPYVTAALALGVSLFVAWLLWRLIESPSLRWAQKIHYGRKRVAANNAAGMTAEAS